MSYLTIFNKLMESIFYYSEKFSLLNEQEQLEYDNLQKNTTSVQVNMDTSMIKSYFNEHILNSDSYYQIIYVDKNASLNRVIDILFDSNINNFDFFERILRNDSSYDNDFNIIFATQKCDILLKIIFSNEYENVVYIISQTICDQYNDSIPIEANSRMIKSAANYY